MVTAPDMRKDQAGSVMRSMLGRARGLGSARSGATTWRTERLTSLALIPLTLWFVWSALRLQGLPRLSVAHWAAFPLNAALLIVLVATTFRHLQMGLQAVIEDYVHSERIKLVSLLLMQAVVVMLGMVGILSILRLALLP